MKVLVADDYPLFRRGVKDILADGLGKVAVEECDNAHDLLDLTRRQPWDVVILDITMPGSTGTETLKRLKTQCPKLPVIILSMHPEDQYAVRMFKAGANAYLTKSSAPEELVQAIKKVVGGGRYVSSTLGEKLAVTLQASAAPVLHEQLSDREYEVMRLIASGQTVSQIADIMHLGVTTISTYRARILEKMKLKNNAELTRYAIKLGLVD